MLVASNQHDQIDGIQLFKSMLTIRLFENKIDLLEGLTVVRRHCTLSRKSKKKFGIRRGCFGKPRETQHSSITANWHKNPSHNRGSQSINRTQSRHGEEGAKGGQGPVFYTFIHLKLVHRLSLLATFSFKLKSRKQNSRFFVVWQRKGQQILKFPILIQLNTDPKVTTLL